MRDLPIYELERELVAAVRGGGRVILEAPTGSGKSTQVPQMLIDNGLVGGGQVVVLQPRRVAARMLARRVAWERGGRPGGEVGFQTRFERALSAGTRIKYETDGILLRQILADGLLAGIGAVVFDEFHERHLYGDLLLGLCLKLQNERRPDLRIVVMSATLDSDWLARFLQPVTVLKSGGRMYPVRVEYLGSKVDFRKVPVWEVAARALGSVVQRQASGDVLVFMPGSHEIRRTVEALRHSAAGKNFDILPLYGELPAEQQDEALQPRARRKIVVATNVAETSLTIDGVTVVIDSGLARKARFDARRGIDTLFIEKVSRASAEQRAGRAGRTAPGLCLRLWTEREHGERVASEEPEVKRVDLAETLLLLKACGFAKAADFPWVEPPDPRFVERGVLLLEDLGAIAAGDGPITDVGRQMVSFPLHPRYARMMIAAAGLGCVRAAALVAALTQEREVLLGRVDAQTLERRFDALGEVSDSDTCLEMRAWRAARASGYDVGFCGSIGVHAQNARRVESLVRQLESAALGQGLPLESGDAEEAVVRKCLMAGFVDQLGKRVAGSRVELVHGRRGSIDRESVVKRAELVVAVEVGEIGRSGGDSEVVLSHVTAVEREWLAELFPGDLRRERLIVYDRLAKRVAGMEEERFRGLLLESGRGSEPTDEEAACLLAGEVLRGELSIKGWDHGVEQWVQRVNLLARECPELGFAEIGESDRRHILEQVCMGARGYKDIKEREVWPVLRSWFAYDRQRLLDEHAPERLTLVNGRKPKVVYEAGRAPSIAARIQELYGVERPLTVGLGRVRVVVQVLAPSQRPVQVTDDMGSFWRDHYERVKRELCRKYPKHEWR